MSRMRTHPCSESAVLSLEEPKLLAWSHEWQHLSFIAEEHTLCRGSWTLHLDRYGLFHPCMQCVTHDWDVRAKLLFEHANADTTVAFWRYLMVAQDRFRERELPPSLAFGHGEPKATGGRTSCSASSIDKLDDDSCSNCSACFLSDTKTMYRSSIGMANGLPWAWMSQDQLFAFRSGAVPTKL